MQLRSSVSPCLKANLRNSSMVSTSFPSKFRLSKRVHASSLRDLRELHRRYKRHTVDQDAQGQRGLLTDPFPSLPFLGLSRFRHSSPLGPTSFSSLRSMNVHTMNEHMSCTNKIWTSTWCLSWAVSLAPNIWGLHYWFLFPAWWKRCSFPLTPGAGHAAR